MIKSYLRWTKTIKTRWTLNDSRIGWKFKKEKAKIILVFEWHSTPSKKSQKFKTMQNLGDLEQKVE